MERTATALQTHFYTFYNKIMIGNGDRKVLQMCKTTERLPIPRSLDDT